MPPLTKFDLRKPRCEITKHATHGLILFLLFFAIGCSREFLQKFVMPTWDTNLSMPLFDHTYTLSDIVGGDSVLSSGSGGTTYAQPIWSTGTLATSNDMKLAPVTFGNCLKISAPPAANVVHQLGIFDVGSTSSATFLLDVGDLLGSNSIVGRIIIPPPIQSMKYTSDPSSSFNQFKTVTISSAELSVTVENGFCATINFPDGLSIEDSAGNTLLSVPIPGNSLQPYQSYSTKESIANITFPNNFKLSASISSPGGQSPVLVKSDTLILITVKLNNIKASSAMTIIQPQAPVVIEGMLGFPDSDKVEHAGVDSGLVNISFTNGFDLPCSVHLAVNGLKDPQGNYFTKDIDLDNIGNPESPNPASRYSQQISLQNWSIDLGATPLDSMPYSVTATILGSDSKFVNISSLNSIKASLQISKLKLNSVTGIVHLKTPVVILPDTQRVDLSFLKGASFGNDKPFGDSTKLTLNLNLTGNLPMDAHICIKARSTTSNIVSSDSAVVDQMLYPGAQGNAVVLGKCFVNMLNDFVATTGTLPDEFIISKTTLINPTGMEGTVCKTDGYYGTAMVFCPLNIGFANFNYSESTSNIVLTQTINKSLGDIDSGQIVFDTNNGIPLEIKLSAQVIDTLTKRVMFTLPDTGSFVVGAANDFFSDGTVRTQMFSRNTAYISPGRLLC